MNGFAAALTVTGLKLSKKRENMSYIDLSEKQYLF